MSSRPPQSITETLEAPLEDTLAADERHATDDTLSTRSLLAQRSPSTPPQWGAMIGATLGGCKIESILGAGGMGVVFKARHLALDLNVALKCLPPHAAGEAARSRFSLEAKAAAKLTHPNVVSVYHAGEESGLHFIVMELVEGESLEERIKRRGALPVDEALGYILDLCKALDYAERLGVVHRDLKPANILINRDGVAKLADLGLVKLTSTPEPALSAVTPTEQRRHTPSSPHQTRVGVAMGTPHYIAPEQVLDAKSVDHRADLYSLGCTLFHALCGRPPFQSRDVQELFTLHTKAKRPSARAERPELPPQLDELLTRLLSIKPQARPPSALALERELLALPLSLPSRHQSASSLSAAQLSSLQEAQRTTRDLKKHLKLLTIISSAAIGALVYGLLDDEPQRSSLPSHSSPTHPQLNTQLNTQRALSALELAEEAQRTADRALSEVGTSSARLIKRPRLATEHYWNAMIHRVSGDTPAQLSALWAAFEGGLTQIDLLEEWAEVSQALHGREATLAALKRAQLASPHPAFELISSRLEGEPQRLITRALKALLQHKKAVSAQGDSKAVEPLYLPLLFEALSALNDEEGQSRAPLFERLELSETLITTLKAETAPRRRAGLKRFYLSRERRVAALDELRTLSAQLKPLIKQMKTAPLAQHKNIALGQLSLTSYPSGPLYPHIKGLKALYPVPDELKLTTPQGRALPQATLSARFKGQAFTRPHNAYLPEGTPQLQQTLPVTFKGRLAYELTDTAGLKSYVVMNMDARGERIKELKDLLEAPRWYEGMSKFSYVIIGSAQYLETTGEAELSLLLPLINRFEGALEGLEVQLLSGVSGEGYAEGAPLTQNITLDQQAMTLDERRPPITLTLLTPRPWIELKPLKPILLLSLTLRGGEKRTLSAPLWSLMTTPPLHLPCPPKLTCPLESP